MKFLFLRHNFSKCGEFGKLARLIEKTRITNHLYNMEFLPESYSIEEDEISKKKCLARKNRHSLIKNVIEIAGEVKLFRSAIDQVNGRRLLQKLPY